MGSQFGQTIQYLYFLRFSLFLWLFPLIFALGDSGWLPFSTRTLSRGIFVPEYLSGYCCVAFFLVSKGFVSLISGRTVVLNGCERFRAKPPNWMTCLLANDKGQHELWPVVLSQIPALLTCFYLLLVGLNEGVLWQRIVLGILYGTATAVIFWYVINAWYYLAYERPDAPTAATGVPLEPLPMTEIPCVDPPQFVSAPPPTAANSLTLGENAARTILFPRWLFGLQEPGSALSEGSGTLEDISTALRGSGFAKGSQRLACWLGSTIQLSGYLNKEGRVFEAQIFVFIATIAFTAFFWVLYPLTAPALNKGVRLAFAALAAALVFVLAIVMSGKGIRKPLLHFWKFVLGGSSTIFCCIVVSIYVRTRADRFPVLASVLLLVIVIGWVLSGLAFFFDRYRIPVLTTFLLLTVVPRVFHGYSKSEEHFASTVAVKSNDSTDADIPTPAEIVDERLTEDAEIISQSRPFIIVTATGGGLHASAWTARILEQLNIAFEEEDKKRQAKQAKAEDSREVSPPGQTETELFQRHMLLLSTVSGSSAALAYYLREIDPATNGGQPNFDRMIVAAQCSSLEAVGWGLLYYDLGKAIFPIVPLIIPASPGDGDLEGSPLGKDRTWALRRGMARNSFDPYCIGAADENEGEAAVVGAADKPAVPWYLRLWPSGTDTMQPPQTLGGIKAMKGMPAFTMNTTTAEAGDRFLLANYRLPDYPIGPVEGLPAESFLDLFKADIRADLPIPTAIQLSATFPYVSSAARIPISYGAESEHFVDGGYYDDDGTSSVIEFLRYALVPPMDKVQGNRDAGFPKSVNKKLTQSGGKLRVILIEIRNSKDNDVPVELSHPRALNPSSKSSPGFHESGLLGQLGFPLEGFWNAGHSSVTGRDRNGLDLLVKAQGANLSLRHIILDNVTDPTSQFGIKSADDPLSWSLTPHEREQIRESADPGNGLRKCYEEVVKSFEVFDTSTNPLPMRCSGSAPLKKGSKINNVDGPTTEPAVRNVSH
jgi:hypothetical protein